jgi:hypothetical protein
MRPEKIGRSCILPAMWYHIQNEVAMNSSNLLKMIMAVAVVVAIAWISGYFDPLEWIWGNQ